MDVERQSVQQDPVTGSQEIVHTQEHIPSESAVKEHKGNQANAYIWYVVGLIEVFLLARLVFLLLGANTTGFTSFLYGLTDPFVAPFRGIFPSPGGSGGYFSTATILAMILYALIGWGISALIDISKRSQPAE